MPKRLPNILFIMADQLNAFSLGCYGNDVVQSPNIDRLASNGVVFDNAYCNSPLCAPSRFSFMSGQMISAINAFDNAAYFSSATPTLAHYLRKQGYATTLSGKMHFVGTDQLHGFEQRLTTDIYPADFGWVPDWGKPNERIDWWYHNLQSVTQAGIAETSNQLQFDDETAARAAEKLYELARRQNREDRPFALFTSFTHPHDPYATRKRYWDLYADDAIDMPHVAPIDFADLDPHSQRLFRVSDSDRFTITAANVRNARRAYYGNISYIDEQIGKLLDILRATDLADNTVVVVTSDHGDMLGERGLWYKMSFLEASSRVPLIVHWPNQFTAARRQETVSLVDMLPTLTDLASQAGAANVEPVEPIAGHSLLPLLNGNSSWNHDVIGEYCGEGSIAPIIMIRREHYKLIHSPVDPDQLFDLATDPHELSNLANDPAHASVMSALHETIKQRWDLAQLHQTVIADQKKRRFLFDALSNGAVAPWDFQPTFDATARYMRNHLDLNDVEAQTRYPPPAGES